MTAAKASFVRPISLLAWITTEAVRTKSRRIVLGDSLSQFMAELDISENRRLRGLGNKQRAALRKRFDSR